MLGFNKKTLLLILGLAIFLMVALLLFLGSQGRKQPDQVQVEKINPLQRTVIGKTRDSELVQLPGLQEKAASTEGRIKYKFESVIPLIPSEVLTKDGVVVLEKINTPDSPSQAGYGRLEDFVKELGEPERKIGGSRTFGYYVDTHIFANKGITIIANQNTGEVFQIQIYRPTTVDKYLTDFGDDIIDVGEIPTEADDHN